MIAVLDSAILAEEYLADGYKRVVDESWVFAGLAVACSGLLARFQYWKAIVVAFTRLPCENRVQASSSMGRIL